MSKEELPTPALLIDLDVLEKNIRTMSEYYKGRKNAGIIPTRKAIGCPSLQRNSWMAGLEVCP